MAWKLSRYTHRIALGDGSGILHNGRSGAVIRLSSAAFARSAGALSEDDPLLAHLVAGEFVVDSTRDELAELEEQFERSRRNSALLFTILPTFACNLACDYCFVATKSGRLSREHQQALIGFAAERIEGSGKEAMLVDWFGGEPLLALDIIESLSTALTGLCDTHGIGYTSQVITNGTLLTKENVETLLACRVERLQITLDGIRAVHDARRRSKHGGSSFDAILAGIEQAFGRFLIRLRINVDRTNQGDLFELIDLFDAKGWLGADTSFYPYLARISPYTTACAAVSECAVSTAEFHALNVDWMQRLHARGVPVVQQPLYGFPEPRLYSCGAIGANGFVFTPGGEIHKCGLEIDDRTAAVGTLGYPPDPSNANAAMWRSWSPFAVERCRECAFLPTCLGGCARNHLQDRAAELAGNCAYFRQFEGELVAAHLRL